MQKRKLLPTFLPPGFGLALELVGHEPVEQGGISEIALALGAEQVLGSKCERSDIPMMEVGDGSDSAFRGAVRKRVATNPAFGAALLGEGIDAMLAGDVDTGKAILRDYLKGDRFEKLAGWRDIRRCISCDVAI